MRTFLERPNDEDDVPELRSNLPRPLPWASPAGRSGGRWVSRPRSDKPKVAIVNTSSELAACYAHLDEIADALKHQLRALGVLPFEIRTVAPSDFVTSAGRAGPYILPSRDLIVNDIEAAVEGAKLDGMICLSSCDKTTPAHLMAAGRLDIPTVVSRAATSTPGSPRAAKRTSKRSSCGRRRLPSRARRPTPRRTRRRRDPRARCVRGPGDGELDAHGGRSDRDGGARSAPVRANGERMWDSVARSAAAIVDLIERDIRPREIITDGSIRNAVRTMLAVGGSINTIKHLQAIAVESGLDIDVWETFRTMGRDTPLLASVRPNGPWLVEDFEDAGGGATVCASSCRSWTATSSRSTAGRSARTPQKRGRQTAP